MTLRRSLPLMLLVSSVAAHASAATSSGRLDGMDEDAARLVQEYRRPSPADPEDVRRIDWTRWDAGDVTCRTGGQALLEAFGARHCTKYFTDLGSAGWEYLQALFAIFASGGQVSDAAWEGLELMAQGLNLPGDLPKCLGHTYVTWRYPPGEERDIWLARSQAVGDALSLGTFLKAMSVLPADDVAAALGGTAEEAAAGLLGTTSEATTQHQSWAQSLWTAWQTTNAGRLTSIDHTLFEAERQLAGCAANATAVIADEARDLALVHVLDTRRWVTAVEQRVYCELPTPQEVFDSNVLWEDTNGDGVGDLSPEMTHGRTARALLSARPDREQLLRDANADERAAVAKYAEVLRRREGMKTSAAEKGERLDALFDAMGQLSSRAAAARASCDDGATAELIRDLHEWQRHECFAHAWATLGLSASPRQIEEDLRRSGTAREALFIAAREAESAGRAFLPECRFDEAISAARARLAIYDEQWQPQGFTLGMFRHCWDERFPGTPWPPAALLEAIVAARADVASRRGAARASLVAAETHLAACGWAECLGAIDAARAAVSGVPCSPLPADFVGLQQEVDALQARLDERQAVVQGRIARLQAAQRDLLHSIEVELYHAEDPAHPERCSSADRVVEMSGLAPGMATIAECDGFDSSDFLARVQAAAASAAEAKQRNVARLQTLQSKAAVAADRCDGDVLDSYASEVASLSPRPCGSNVDAVLADLKSRREIITADTAAFRDRLAELEAEWQLAWDTCQVETLRGLVHRITAWAANDCARANVSEAERARARPLQARAADVETLAWRRAEAESALTAKLAVLRGVIRTLQSEVGRDYDLTYYREIVQRKVAEGRDVVFFGRQYENPAVPSFCYEGVLQAILDQARILEDLAARLPPPVEVDVAHGSDGGGGDWDAAASDATRTVDTAPDPGPTSWDPPVAAPPQDDTAARAEAIAGRARTDQERQREAVGDWLTRLGDAVAEVNRQRERPPTTWPTPSGPPANPTTAPPNTVRSPASGSSGGAAAPCAIVQLIHGNDAAYVLKASKEHPNQPEGFVVVAVPARLEERDRVLCSSGRGCLDFYLNMHGLKGWQLLSSHSSQSAAARAARQRCPNPVNPQGASSGDFTRGGP